jgi:hypothetical protein
MSLLIYVAVGCLFAAELVRFALVRENPSLARRTVVLALVAFLVVALWPAAAAYLVAGFLKRLHR